MKDFRIKNITSGIFHIKRLIKLLKVHMMKWHKVRYSFLASKQGIFLKSQLRFPELPLKDSPICLLTGSNTKEFIQSFLQDLFSSCSLPTMKLKQLSIPPIRYPTSYSIQSNRFDRGILACRQDLILCQL